MSAPIFIVERSFTFDAAHHLPNYRGKCRNVHGHRWKLTVGVRMPLDQETGMALDFAQLKQIVHSEIVDIYDHQDLNNIFDLPTAENICLEIWTQLRNSAFGDALCYVTVKEGENTQVTYRGHVERRVYDSEQMED